MLLSRQNTAKLLKTLPQSDPVQNQNNVQDLTQEGTSPSERRPKEPNLEDIDLLAGHDFGGNPRLERIQSTAELSKILVWQKFDTVGYLPAAREVRKPKQIRLN
jgi:hypothetical protein